MQITANQTSAPITTQLNQTAKDLVTPELKEVITPDLSATLVATTSPATQVSFSGLRDAADIYEQPKLVDIVQMNYTQDKGEAATKTSQLIAADATNLRKSRSPFSPSAFLNQIGSLSRETTSYKNAAFSYQLASTRAADKLKLNYTETGGKPQETVTLRVRTKDGDTIDIKIQHGRSAVGDNLEFTFDVTGELSEAEQNALEKLANKLGQVADDFFRTGTTELHGLKEFDQANLKDFHIEFSKIKTGDAYNTLSYDFSVDEKTQTQHLKAKDGDGYGIDITSDLQKLLGTSGTSFNRSLENYLTIIRETFNEHQPLQQEHSNMQSKRFILDGFTSMLSTGSNQKASPATSLADKALDAFDTGLPDFTAAINAPTYVYRDPKRNLTLPESMSLTLAQRTETEALPDGTTLVRQVNSFERNSQQIKGIAGSEKGDLKTGNFIYQTIHEKQEISRTLHFNDADIKNLITEQTNEKETTLESYLNFKLTDSQKYERNDYKITQLLDEINKHKTLKQQFDSLNYIALSNDKLFS